MLEKSSKESRKEKSFYPKAFDAIVGVFFRTSFLFLCFKSLWMQVVSMLSLLTHTVELARCAAGAEIFFGSVSTFIFGTSK